MSHRSTASWSWNLVCPSWQSCEMDLPLAAWPLEGEHFTLQHQPVPFTLGALSSWLWSQALSRIEFESCTQVLRIVGFKANEFCKDYLITYMIEAASLTFRNCNEGSCESSDHPASFYGSSGVSVMSSDSRCISSLICNESWSCIVMVVLSFCM